MVIQVTRRAYPLIVAICAQGCIVLPAPYPPTDHNTIIEKESLEFIQTGQTRREDVRQQLGPPDWSFNGGSRWIYKTSSHKSGGTGACAVTFGDIGDCRPPKKLDRVTTFLDLNFNSSSVINKHELSSAKLGTCTESKVCFYGDNNLYLHGSIDDDAHAKEFRVEPNRCAVNLYTMKTFSPIFIQIDDSETTHRLWTDAGFLRITLNSGEHKIAVSDHRATIRIKFGESANTVRETKEFSENIEFDCVSEGIYFMREHHGDKDSFSFTMVPNLEGRRQIAKRYVIILPDLELSPQQE